MSKLPLPNDIDPATVETDVAVGKYRFLTFKGHARSKGYRNGVQHGPTAHIMTSNAVRALIERVALYDRLLEHSSINPLTPEGEEAFAEIKAEKEADLRRAGIETDAAPKAEEGEPHKVGDHIQFTVGGGLDMFLGRVARNLTADGKFIYEVVSGQLQLMIRKLEYAEKDDLAMQLREVAMTPRARAVDWYRLPDSFPIHVRKVDRR